VADIPQALNHVLAQGDVERLAINPDSGPLLGWIFSGPAVRLPDPLSLGQDP